MRKHLLTTLLVLLTTATYAQKKVAGYIITLQNDTLRGTIVDKGNFHHSHTVTFTAANASESKTYSAQEIKGFVIGTEVVYESQDLMASFLADKLFAKRLLQGYASLYVTVPQRSNPVYLLRKPDGSTVALDEKYYFGLLKLHLSDCPSIRFDEKDRISYRYRETSLVALLARYNQCRSPQTPQVRLRHQFPVTYGLLLGASLNRYRSQNDYVKGDYSRNVSPNAGAFVGFSVGRAAGVELQLQYNHFSGYLLHSTSSLYGDHTFQFQMQSFTTSLLFRYFLLDQLYVSPGFNVTKVFRQSGTEHLYGQDHPFVAYPTSISPGYMLGLGTRFRLLDKTTLLEARYNVGSVLNSPNQEAKTSSVQLLLRMNLAKR